MTITANKTHLIVRDFRGERVFLSYAKLGRSPEFNWSANRSRALKFTVARARQIIIAHCPYAHADASLAVRSVVAMQAKLPHSIALPALPAQHDVATTAAAKLDAYNDAMRVARMLGRLGADYRRPLNRAIVEQFGFRIVS